MLRVQVIPVYCFDPRQFRGTPRGNPKTGAYRTKFLLESVLALQNSLRAVGSDLLIANGTPEDVFTGVSSRRRVVIRPILLSIFRVSQRKIGYYVNESVDHALNGAKFCH